MTKENIVITQDDLESSKRSHRKIEAMLEAEALANEGTDISIDEYMSHKTPQISYEAVRHIVPKRYSRKMVQLAVEAINEVVAATEEHMQAPYLDNVMGVMNELFEMRSSRGTSMSIVEFLKLVRFCTYRLSGDSDTKAYIKAYPDRLTNPDGSEIGLDQIAGRARSVAGGALCTRLMKRLMIPAYLAHMGAFNKAVEVQMEIMTSEKASFSAKTMAANSVMTHLKMPDENKIQLEVGATSNVVSDIIGALNQLSEEQSRSLQKGELTLNNVRKQVVETDG